MNISYFAKRLESVKLASALESVRKRKQASRTPKPSRDSNSLFRLAMPLLLAVLLAVGACSKKPSIKSQVNELEKAFPAAAAPGADAIQPSAAPQPASQTDPNAYVNLALSAVRSNDYAGGIIALQTVQRMRGVTAEQMMAAERAKQALTAELVTRAASGDPSAQAALSAIEKTRSQ